MKLWVDDVRPAPEGYVWVKSVNQAIAAIESCDFMNNAFNLEGHYSVAIIDIDHDAGDYAFDGGDFIKLLDWLEETGRNYPIRIHSMNPVGVENMHRIIQRNGWEEIS